MKELGRRLDEDRSFALATVVEVGGSAPRKPGAKMIIYPDGSSFGTIGGGALEAAILEIAGECLRSGQSRLVSYNLRADLGMACGGQARVFIEPLLSAPRLYIYGAGHICASLCPLAENLGFMVTVVDTREDLANKLRLPAAAAFVHSFDPDQWGRLTFDGETFCVVVTTDHKTDEAVVRALLDRSPKYIGMIGSKRKRETLMKNLQQSGVPEAHLERIHSPIGLPIKAESPQEIAVSIAAELIKIRRTPAPTPGPTESKEEE